MSLDCPMMTAEKDIRLEEESTLHLEFKRCP
jgi:hypothetical protein